MNKYQHLRCNGKLYGTIKRAVALRAARDANPPRHKSLDAVPFLKRISKHITLIPLGVAGIVEAREIQAQHPRKKNWTSREPTTDKTRLRTDNLGSYSRRAKWIHFTYTTLIQSFGIACGRSLLFTFNGSRSRITAPHGYRWSRDENGIKLVANADPLADYHPTASDLQGPKSEMVAKLKANLATRRALAKKERHQISSIKKAEREGATVCIHDSLRAGNCLAGTRTFCFRHSFDPVRHYKPSEVLALANGDASRVALVVAVALKRHREEMNRGYALLSDHQPV